MTQIDINKLINDLDTAIALGEACIEKCRRLRQQLQTVSTVKQSKKSGLTIHEKAKLIGTRRKNLLKAV